MFQKTILHSLKISLLVSLILFSQKIISQVEVVWANYPGGVSIATDQLHHVYSTNWDYNPAGDITVTKRNSDGDILWETSYDNLDQTRHEVATWIETDSQNNSIVSGTIRSGFSSPVNAASLLMKFNPEGGLAWRVVFNSDFEGSYTTKIVVDEEDNIYVLGLGNGDSGLVTRVKKFNSDGVEIWTYYDTNGIGAPVNIKLTSDSGILISARGTTGILNGYLKLSLGGQLLWYKSGISSPTVGDLAGDSFGNTYLINGENVLANGGSILEKLDENGNTIWSVENTMAGTKVEIGTDDHPIISGFPSAGIAGAAFMKFDADGTLIWENLNADGPEMLFLHGQLKLDDSNNAYLGAGNLFNMAICKINNDGTNGWVALVSGGNSASSFTIDTDHSIYLTGGITAKLFDTANRVTENSSDFRVELFPNPFTHEIRLITPNPSGNKQATILTLEGKLMYSINFTGSFVVLPLHHLIAGNYILHVTNHRGQYFLEHIIKQ